MVFYNNAIAGAAGQSTGGGGDAGYKIERSVRFTADNTTHFSNNFSAGHANRQKFTFSFWAKFWGSDYAVLSAGTSSSGGYFELKYNSSSKLEIFGENITSTTCEKRLVDRSAWYHCCLVIDKGHSTDTERAKFFVNGIRQTLSTTSQSNTSSVYWGHQSQPHRIGGRSWSSSDQGNFYLAEFHYLDGIVPGVSTDSNGSVTGEVGAQYIDEFVEWDSNGVVQPKAYTGSYGTYGTYLDFSDVSTDAALGNDASGSNDWTNNNLRAVAGSNNNSVSSFSHSGYTASQPSANFLDGDDSTFYAVVADSSNSTTTAEYTLGTNVSGTAEVLFANGNAQVTGRISIDGGSSYTALPTQSASWYNLGNMNGNNIRIRATFNSGGGSTAYFYGFRVGGTQVIATADTEVDSFIDSPTNYDADSGNNGGNYCTLNPADQSGGTLSNGNLDYNLGSGTKFVSGTIAVKSGKWYWEGKAVSGVTNGSVGGRFGISQIPSTMHGENGPFTLTWHATAGIQTFISGSGTTRLSGTGYSDGDVLGLALDADSNISYWYKNGSLIYTYDFSSLVAAGSQFLAPSTWNGSSGTPVWKYNFGQSSFAHTPRTNHKSLCTNNLPTPDIADGSTKFDCLLYTGTAQTQAVSGLSFSPDLVWLRRRNGSGNNNIQDVLRGATQYMQTDYNGSELTSGSRLSSIDSNGFTLTSDNGGNTNTGTYVAWCFDGGSTRCYSTEVSGTFNNGQRADKIFDGLITTQANLAGSSSGSFTWTLASPLTVSSSLEVYMINGKSKFTVNGGTQTSALNSGSWQDLGFTGSLSSLQVQGDTVGNTAARLAAIRIDGTIVTDPCLDTNGSLRSLVKASPLSGFSVVSWTGNRSAGATVGHGLGGKTPEIVIVKNRAQNSNWMVYTKPSGAGGYLALNQYWSYQSASSVFNNTAPSGTVFTLGADSESNGNGDDMIAYCIAPIDSYSAVGSYVGNGSDSGPFIFTGFRPAMVWTKAYSSNSHNNTGWNIRDTTRDPSNFVDQVLSATNADQTLENSHTRAEFLSNGFRLKSDTNGQSNYNGWTYVYYAVAENPFKNARAF